MEQKKARFLTGSTTVANIPELRKAAKWNKYKDFPKTAKPSAHSIPNSWSEPQKQHTGIRSSLILYLQRSSKSLNQIQKKWLLFPGLASDILPTSCNYIIFIYLCFSFGRARVEKWQMGQRDFNLKTKRNLCLQRNKRTDSPSYKGQSGTLLQLWGPLMVQESCHEEILPGSGIKMTRT